MVNNLIMDSENIGVLDYGIYQILFLLAIIMSVYVLHQVYVVVIVCVIIFKMATELYDHYICKDFDTEGRGVFITGCDTGLGNRIARYLDEKGFTVFAGCLNVDSPGAVSLRNDCSSKINIVDVNTTKQESIVAAFEYVKKKLPSRGLWAIINNAGMNMFGDVELQPVSIYEKGFELNLYGYIHVMKTFLPLIRKTKGRIVNVTSVRGRIVEPNQSNYGTAKHALETLSDSLRLEMIKFGVKVCMIEPGNFGDATAIASEAVAQRNYQENDEMWKAAKAETKQGYTREYLDSWINPPVGGWPPKMCSIVVAKAAAHALCSSVPKHRYLIHGKGSIVPFADEYVVLSHVHNLLPTWIVDKYMVVWKGLYKDMK